MDIVPVLEPVVEEEYEPALWRESAEDVFEPLEDVEETFGPQTYDEFVDEVFETHNTTISEMRDAGIGSTGRTDYKCGICGKVGFNARTHPHHPEV